MGEPWRKTWEYLLGVLPGNDELVKHIILSIVGTAIAAPLFIWLVGKLQSWMGARWKSWATNRDAKARVNRAREAITSNAGVWLAKRGTPPAGYELTLKTGIPILVVGHLKGGVGKTTVAANLAAYYAVNRPGFAGGSNS